MQNQTTRGLYLLNLFLLMLLIILICVSVYLYRSQNSEDIPITTDDPDTPSTAAEKASEEIKETHTAAENSVMEYAESNGIDYSEYPKSLIELLARNPETKEFVLEYPTEKDLSHTIDLSAYSCDTVPLFMQWDQRWGYLEYGGDVAGLTACGPVCLSMVAYYLTGNEAYDPAYMMEFAKNNGYCVPGDGTSWTLISEGGILLGLDVIEIPLDENRIKANLEVGNPIICVVGPGDFTTTGHYIVLTGLEDGCIRVNDPNSHENSQRLWTYREIKDQIENLWVIR